jgi:glycosyltransferase involved in cell wall biosynthesis
MKNPSERILLFIKVPPPLTGATLMNKQVYESKFLRENFDFRSLLISYSSSIDELGKIRFKKFVVVVKIYITLLRECILFKPRFIYFQISPTGMSFYRDLFYILLIKLFGIKIVYHLHGKGIIKKSKKWYLALLYRFAFRGSDIICLSGLIKDDLKDVYCGVIYIVNNGIKVIPECESNYYMDLIETDQIHILFLSNLIKSKGILEFIESLTILAESRIKFKANIVGAEGDITSNHIVNLINELKLEDRITYLGPIYGSEKNAIILSSDLLVYPSSDDSFPLVLLEVMQLGKPIIATIEGGIPEIVDDGITGFLVEKHNPQQIADKIKIMVDDAELRKNMGSAGRDKFLKNYTLEIFESNLRNVFDEILKEMEDEKRIEN